MTGLTFSSDNYNEFKETGDKDLFERVVVDLTLENNSEDVELIEYINSLPKRDKRIAVAATLGDNVLWNKLNDVLNQNPSSYKRLQSVYFLLKDYVKIADVERKQHGEILTPFKELAEPMIKLVEKYDSKFWKNKYNKVLDSSAGYGTFLILAAYKFMVGLKDEIQDEEERFKWIVENCLYYGELQSKSVFSWLLAIDPYDEYKTNTYWGSFLTDAFDKHAKEVWGVEKFDLIIQNPPYQVQKPGFKKTQAIWNHFVKKSITILNENSYMVMVHPSGWRSLDGDYKDVQNLLKGKLKHLVMNDDKEGQRIFGATTSFDWYLFSNKDVNFTIVIDQNDVIHKVDLRNWEFIPNGEFEILNNLISKDKNKVKILHSYSSYETRKPHISKEKDEKFKYPCVYTITKDNTINLFWSSTNENGHFGIPKIIWTNGMASQPTIDNDGEYGLTQFAYAIVDDVCNLKNIKKAMDSERFVNLMKICYMSSGNRFDRKVLSTFKKDFWKEFI